MCFIQRSFWFFQNSFLCRHARLSCSGIWSLWYEIHIYSRRFEFRFHEVFTVFFVRVLRVSFCCYYKSQYRSNKQRRIRLHNSLKCRSWNFKKWMSRWSIRMTLRDIYTSRILFETWSDLRLSLNVIEFDWKHDEYLFLSFISLWIIERSSSL